MRLFIIAWTDPEDVDHVTMSDASSMGRSQIDFLLRRIVSLNRKSFSGVL